MNPHQVIQESRPMLEDVLGTIGLHAPGQILDLSALLDPFSQWAEIQEVQPEDNAYMTALIGAFICEYLLEYSFAIRVIRADRIFLQVRVESGVLREFEPYTVAQGLVQNHGRVADFIRQMTAE